MHFVEDNYIKQSRSAPNVMAADYSEEPKCTQKGTGWVTFSASENTLKKRLLKKKIIKLSKKSIM